MPYMPYTKLAFNKHGKKVPIWKEIKRKCLVCETPLITRNPYKVYCSKKCNNVDTTRRRAERRRVQSGTP